MSSIWTMYIYIYRCVASIYSIYSIYHHLSIHHLSVYLFIIYLSIICLSVFICICICIDIYLYLYLSIPVSLFGLSTNLLITSKTIVSVGLLCAFVFHVASATVGSVDRWIPSDVEGRVSTSICSVGMMSAARTIPWRQLLGPLFLLPATRIDQW